MLFSFIVPQNRQSDIINSKRNTNEEKTLNETTITPLDGEVSSPEENPDWAHDALQELEDWIESQGIYIRQ